jgi:hypothetical protein
MSKPDGCETVERKRDRARTVREQGTFLAWGNEKYPWFEAPIKQARISAFVSK